MVGPLRVDTASRDYPVRQADWITNQQPVQSAGGALLGDARALVTGAQQPGPAGCRAPRPEHGVAVPNIQSATWRCGGFYRLRGMTRTTMRVMMLKIKPRIPNRTAL